MILQKNPLFLNRKFMHYRNCTAYKAWFKRAGTKAKAGIEILKYYRNRNNSLVSCNGVEYTTENR